MRNIILLFSLLTLASCRTAQMPGGNENSQNVKAEVSLRAYSVQSVLWQQRAAEYRALCHQAFNLARMQLDQILATDTPHDKPLAIITDIDETVLDNSPFNATMIIDERDFTREEWINWGTLESAEAVPGALDFFRYAASKGVDIYYISNRYISQQPETMRNLRKLGFPSIEPSRFLLREKSSGKEERRQSVYEESHVVMYLGDNLSDFSELFDGQSTEQRNDIVERLKLDFGRAFIVLPNPMYGDWESKGIYEGSYEWTPVQKDSLRKAKLVTY